MSLPAVGHSQAFHSAAMFSSRKGCSYCGRPLPFGMFHFCCNECQRCWHRARGTAPSGWSQPEFRRLLGQQKQELDAHERQVKGGAR